MLTVYFEEAVTHSQSPLISSCTIGNDLGDKDTVVSKNMLIVPATSNREPKTCHVCIILQSNYESHTIPLLSIPFPGTLTSLISATRVSGFGEAAGGEGECSTVKTKIVTVIR